ncbi:MAG: hypothetical protein OWS03_01465 [Alicyclobacillaceae bacterium]|nr:hypothetical protein [Alicyclobacillaceae bacterium]
MRMKWMMTTAIVTATILSISGCGTSPNASNESAGSSTHILVSQLSPTRHHRDSTNTSKSASSSSTHTPRGTNVPSTASTTTPIKATLHSPVSRGFGQHTEGRLETLISELYRVEGEIAQINLTHFGGTPTLKSITLKILEPPSKVSGTSQFSKGELLVIHFNESLERNTAGIPLSTGEDLIVTFGRFVSRSSDYEEWGSNLKWLTPVFSLEKVIGEGNDGFDVLGTEGFNYREDVVSCKLVSPNKFQVILRNTNHGKLKLDDAIPINNRWVKYVYLSNRNNAQINLYAMLKKPAVHYSPGTSGGFMLVFTFS